MDEIAFYDKIILTDINYFDLDIKVNYIQRILIFSSMNYFNDLYCYENSGIATVNK